MSGLECGELKCEICTEEPIQTGFRFEEQSWRYKELQTVNVQQCEFWKSMKTSLKLSTLTIIYSFLFLYYTTIHFSKFIFSFSIILYNHYIIYVLFNLCSLVCFKIHFTFCKPFVQMKWLNVIVNTYFVKPKL